MKNQDALVELLLQIESLMQKQQLWQAVPPSAQALQSTEPFAIDTLTPEEWLQWIFIPRFHQLLASNQTLPSGFSITPYYEEAWKTQPELAPILEMIKQVDKLCH